MSLLPTTLIKIRKVLSRDVYAKEELGRPIGERCSVVRLTRGSKKTTVRTDSSASRGAAQEQVADAVLLLSPKTIVGENDQVEVMGTLLRVSQMHPRFTVHGKLDHFEVECAIWE